MSFIKKQLQKILLDADIIVNGTRPWDIKVLNEKVYSRVFFGGSMAFGESYMEGWWEVDDLAEFFNRILSQQLNNKFIFSWQGFFLSLQAVLFNLQAKSRSFMVGQRHYDIGNDVYTAMLDKRLVYTCAYWNKAKTLDKAQEAKLELVCKKLGLKPGDRVLDIGCGWGSFLKYAAEKYGIKGVGVTVSKEQMVLAKELCKGLPIEIYLQDYRDMEGSFDHIVSLGMFEHVGVKNYATYMQKAHELLKDGGLFLLHTIGSNRSLQSFDPWINKYIFPNGILPSIAQIGTSIEGRFIMEDWHNFGVNYDKTLMAWFENFNKQWPLLKKNKTETFYRMWKYYLLSCAGNFRSRNIQLWQVVLSKKGVAGGYTSIR